MDVGGLYLGEHLAIDVSVRHRGRACTIFPLCWNSEIIQFVDEVLGDCRACDGTWG